MPAAPRLSWSCSYGASIVPGCAASAGRCHTPELCWRSDDQETRRRSVMGTPQYSNDPAQVQGQGQVPAAQAPMPPPPPFRLVPQQGSRLEQLRGSLEAARAAVAEAKAREKAIADGIKFEAVSMAPPGTTSI